MSGIYRCPDHPRAEAVYFVKTGTPPRSGYKCSVCERELRTFCIECVHYHPATPQIPDHCTAPENLADCYIAPKSKPINRPEEMNRKNNCRSFERKPVEKDGR